MVHRPRGSREVSLDILISLATPFEHRSNEGDLPSLKLVSLSAFNFGFVCHLANLQWAGKFGRKQRRFVSDKNQVGLAYHLSRARPPEPEKYRNFEHFSGPSVQMCERIIRSSSGYVNQREQSLTAGLMRTNVDQGPQVKVQYNQMLDRFLRTCGLQLHLTACAKQSTFCTWSEQRVH